MMLSAEAVRLAAIECLAPTSALLGHGGVFPTLAEGRILDSRATAVADLLSDRPFTPIVSVYTKSTKLSRRGEIADYGTLSAETVLEFVVELAVAARDEGDIFADAMAGDDPSARLVLAALAAQVRFTLLASEAGALFRQLAVPEQFESETYSVPQLGLRWQRIVSLLTCTIADDTFDDDGGLPDPLRQLAASLPENSYAAERLVDLAAAFRPIERTPLDQIVIQDGDETPIASIGEFDE